MNFDNFFEQEIILETERARLEPLGLHHFEDLKAIALSNSDIWKFTLANIVDEESFTTYFNTALKEKEEKKSYPFAMFDKQENRYAGCTRYANISFRDKRLEIGWTWIEPLIQGSGLNKHNKYLMLNFAFEELGLNRVELKTAGTNLKSQSVLEKAGFIFEHKFEKTFIKNGEALDELYYSVRKNEK